MSAPLVVVIVVAILLGGCAAPWSDGDGDVPDGGRDVVLSTTTSLIDSGLLDVLTPLFEEQTGYRLQPISVGTGAALAMGARGEADVLFVHAPDAERTWMAQGYGSDRLLVMYNDFVIVGPAGDPVGISTLPGVIDALRAIAESETLWISRDDNSGTHQLEVKLWEMAGIDPRGASWVQTTGQGMGATLTIADQREAYTLSDRGTYLNFRDTVALVVNYEGDPALLNPYHVMPVDPAAFPNLSINAAGGRAFAEFLVSDAAQDVIRGFGVAELGEPLFTPAAGLAESDLR
jgi:tungstate transport system substrate-binding protein